MNLTHEIVYKIEALDDVLAHLSDKVNAILDHYENGIITHDEQDLLLQELHDIYFYVEEMKIKYENITRGH